MHALLGENGAGKTTLSNILTGLYRPDEGEIELYGEPVHFHSPRDALDAGICMVHQHFRLVEPFSVAENVVLGDHRGEGRRFFVHPPAIERRVTELGEKLRTRGRPVGAHLAALGRRAAARRDPEGALPRSADTHHGRADCGAHAAGGGRACLRPCRSMAAEGRTVIFISHKLHEVKAVADRVTVLRGGRTVATVDASEATLAVAGRADGRPRGGRVAEDRAGAHSGRRRARRRRPERRRRPWR